MCGVRENLMIQRRVIKARESKCYIQNTDWGDKREYKREKKKEQKEKNER